MTVGYPDFQAVPMSIGPSIADVTGFALQNTNPFTASGFVTNYPSSRIKVVPGGSTIGASVAVNYYRDSSQTDNLGSYNWVVAPTGGLACIAPNLGPFVVITVTTISGAANSTAIQLTPLSAQAASVKYLAVGNSAVVLNKSVAAGGTDTITTPFIAEGPGYWYFNERGAGGNLAPVIWELSENGSRIFQLDQQKAGTTVVNRQLFGSPRLIQMQVTNNDGVAAHSYDARICIDGR